MADVDEITTGVRAVLSRPSVYNFAMASLGAHRARTVFAADHLGATRGLRVLDVGCGPGELLDYLDDGDYVGVDISADYIADARARYGNRTARFVVGTATEIPSDWGPFDLAVATGVLHHIPDSGVESMLAGVARVLVPDARLVAMDPVLVPGQSRIAEAVIRRDRGQHVRTPEGYAALGQQAFAEVRTTVRHNLLRIPYSHCITEFQSPRT